MSFLDPDKQTKQGGFLDDVDAVVISSIARRHTMVNKDGKVFGMEDEPVWMLTLQAGEVKSEQRYGVGGADRIEPTKDGKTFQAAPGKDMPNGFAENSRGARLMRELKNIGFPELDELVNGNGGKGDFTVLAGHAFHWKEHVEKMSVKDKATGKKTDIEVRTLVPVKYIGKGKTTKGAPAKGTPAPAAKGKAAKAEPEEEDAGIPNRVIEIVNDILTNEDGPITKLALQKKVVAVIDEDEDLKGSRREIIRLLMSDDFLNSDDAPWTFDGKTVSI